MSTKKRYSIDEIKGKETKQVSYIPLTDSNDYIYTHQRCYRIKSGHVRHSFRCAKHKPPWCCKARAILYEDGHIEFTSAKHNHPADSARSSSKKNSTSLDKGGRKDVLGAHNPGISSGVEKHHKMRRRRKSIFQTRELSQVSRAKLSIDMLINDEPQEANMTTFNPAPSSFPNNCPQNYTRETAPKLPSISEHINLKTGVFDTTQERYTAPPEKRLSSLTDLLNFTQESPKSPSKMASWWKRTSKPLLVPEYSNHDTSASFSTQQHTNVQ